MKDLSNAELLALLVGRTSAKALSAKPLAELFGFTRPRQLQLCEEAETYAIHPSLAAAKELFVRCMRERMETGDLCFSSPESVRAYLCSKIGHLEYESFWCLWLDSQNRLIDGGELFRGTITQASVYPREVVKAALAVNAAATIFAHNHPSGVPDPSRPDEMLTGALKSALGLVDVRVLDHFVVAGNQAVSFCERGLL